MPTAPTMTAYAESALPAALVGRDRTAQYVRRLLASGPTLDEATSFHMYAPVASISPIMNLPNLGPATVAQAEDVAAKARSAEPALLAELDARFAALGEAVRRADSIVMPSSGAAAPQPVVYCRFVYNAANLPRPGLGDHLWNRCIADRDAFLDLLARRMAELAVVPGLPTAVEPTRPLPVRMELSADLVLPASIVPGELRAPRPFSRLEAPFEEVLRKRFEAALTGLSDNLRASLARAAASDAYVPADALCNGLLGPYAGPLSGLPASAGVAAHLRDSCMASASASAPAALVKVGDEVEASLHADEASAGSRGLAATRLDFTPASKCAALIAQHFPAVGGRIDRGAPSGGTEEACIAGAARLEAAILDRHLRDAVAASRPDPDALLEWEGHAWFAQPPGGVGWIDIWKDPTALARFRTAYEAAMAPRRKEAAARFAERIQADSAIDTGIEPRAVADACARSRAEAPTGALEMLFGQPGDAERRRAASLEWYAGRPGLTAYETASWIAATCADVAEKTEARRLRRAVAVAAVKSVFAPDEKLAIRAPDGTPVPVDPGKLVDAAAAGGLQVSFQAGGFLSKPGMAITPFGRTSPSLAGTLVRMKRPDGIGMLEVVDLPSMQGLDGPLATVECAALAVGDAAALYRLRTFTAAASALFGDGSGSGEAADARREFVDAQSCATARKAFLQEAGE